LKPDLIFSIYWNYDLKIKIKLNEVSGKILQKMPEIRSFYYKMKIKKYFKVLYIRDK